MPRLVAVTLAGGPRFVEAVRRIWDAGDAVAPLDPAAPDPVRRTALAAIGAGALVDDEGEHPLPDGRPVDDGDALVVLTSGTSGTPRAAVHTHDAIEASAYSSANALGVDPEATWLACLPLHHIGGFGVVARALVTGAGLEVHPGFDPRALADAAARGCTHTSLVPTALARIDPSPWRRILLGGSQIPPDRPANTVATYGMTETCGGIVYDGMPLSGVEVSVDDDGAISLRSPTLLRCYRDGADPVGRDGWFRTGDVGSWNATTGRLSVSGRADDVIVTGGEKVWPTDVEAVLARHPKIAAISIVGREDPEWGARVVAVVVPADPADPPGLDDLRALAKEHLPVAAAPKSLELVTDLPRTSLGKVQRNRL